MFSLVKDAKVTRVSNAVAAGTTTVNSTGVDMAGFDAVAMVAAVGTLTSTAETTVKLQQSDDDGSSDAYSDLEGTSITVADDDDNQLFVAEALRPTKRYVRCVVTRATANAVIDSIVAIQHAARDTPVEQPATTTGEVHVSPAEGTA